MGQKSKFGRCLLTGTEGKLVKCHIIPQALTRPSLAGAPLLQSTQGKGPKRRWSSWYDTGIVTREGEDLLSEIDDKAIKLMRAHGMIWASWVIAAPQFESLPILSRSHSVRKIALRDPAALHLFALSVLWRAAVSRLPEMREVELEVDELATLRSLVLGELKVSPLCFPTSVTQITSIGQQQNMAPIRDYKRVPNFETGEVTEQEIFRIYFDGCILHIHRNASDFEGFQDFAMIIGGERELIVTGVDYETSWQYENFLIVLYETFLGSLGSPIQRRE